MDVFEAIRARRSIRAFRCDPIERGIVEQLLDAAVLAPSAKNSQPWRFTVVSAGKKEEFLKVLRSGVDHRMAEGTEIGTIRWTLRAIEQAPLTILVHNVEGIHPWKARKEHESWWDVATVQSIGAAIQNLLLAATAFGLGSLWIADVWEAYPEIARWLGTDDPLVAAVSLGYADEAPPVPARRSKAEVVRWLM